MQPKANGKGQEDKMRSGSVSRVLSPAGAGRWSFIWACHCWQARAAYPEANAGHV